MSDSMDAMQFTQRAKEDPHLCAFLKEVAEEVDKQISVEKPGAFGITGVDILFGVAAYALYRFVKDYLDHRRAVREAEILKKQAEVIAALTKEKIPPEMAKTTVVELLERIAKRTADDPVLKKAFNLVGKAD